MKEKKKRILICDDSVEFLKTIGAMLTFHGYSPIITKTGRQALDKASKGRTDLVLLDYRLPDMDGTTVLRELKTIDDSLPVVMMTGFGHEKLAAEVIKLGAMDYLAKPFKSGELLESIEKTFRKVEEIKKEEEVERLLLWGKLFPFVAHEIRTPLHSIGGALMLIKNRHQNDKTTARAVQIIHEEIIRLNEFVNQCLDFSRLTSREGLSLFNINETVNSCVQLISPFVKSTRKKLQMDTKLDDSLPPILAHPGEIKQVLINLLRNAVEAIPKEGRIIVETTYIKEGEQEQAEIKVVDTGVGISQEDIGDVFTPFFSRKRAGVGLGLAICKKIIQENHHGQIRLESNPSEGTTISVILPIAVRIEPTQEASRGASTDGE